MMVKGERWIAAEPLRGTLQQMSRRARARYRGTIGRNAGLTFSAAMRRA